jgi:hypothetical protein
MRQILALDPTCYPRHLIHGPDRTWAETNCDVDVWVELLHAWGFEPLAALPFTLAIDFEGEQWTFFKFPHADLRALYGLDVQEVTIWRPLAVHVEEQVALGRPVLLEVSSYHLPDTAGTAYRREHVKTTVAVVAIDVEARRLGYFHNQGYHHLHGEDFTSIFRLEGPHSPALLPPRVEFVKRHHDPIPRGDDLVLESLGLLRRQLYRLPPSNPFPRFRERFEADLRWLADEPLETFHKYSFVTLRQFGAGYELAATYLHWLEQHKPLPLEVPAAAFTELSTGAKTLLFHLARALARKKPLDLSAIDRLADAWHRAMAHLKAALL